MKTAIKALTKKEMIEIFENKSWSTLNKPHKKQFMNFMFGVEFMQSNDKGSLKQY